VKTIEHDYGSNNPGSTLRIMTKSYKWQDSSSGFLDAGMIDRPATEEVRDGSNGVFLTTTYSYDDANGSPQGTYGDLTKVTKSGGGGTVVTSTVFDGSGMPTQYIDGNSHSQEITYDSSGLYPQKIVAGGLTNEYSVDLNTGVLTSQKDPNGVFVKFFHNDALGRLSSIQSAYGITGVESDKTYQYPLMTQTSITQDLNQTGDGLLQTSQSTDGVGRVTESISFDGKVINSIYNSEGMTTAVSNPHFSTDTDVKYTSYLLDVLGRVRRICNSDDGQDDTTVCAPSDAAHPDASAKSFQYADNLLTYTDEAGHSWTRTSDALGRLTDVAEPGGLQTHYVYNPLDNLTKVTQDGAGEGARVREFSYDGLSRLIAAKNPEQGSGLTCSGAQGSQWSTCYSYDGNGNVKTKTIPGKDSNGNTTTSQVIYDYDDLNRLISKSYSDGKTPTSCFQYAKTTDFGAGSYVVGRLLSAWTQAGSCPATAPQSALTRRTIANYDAFGRVKTEQQCNFGACTTGQPYTVNPSYDLVGNLATYDNGLGTLTITNSYDSGNRLFQVTSSVNDATHPSPLYSISDFTAFGAPLNSMFGGNISITQTYDSRLRAKKLSAVKQ
jgi:YD repeat-containing protein